MKWTVLRIMQAAHGSKSFIEILEAEIRADLRQEIEAEVQARYRVEAPPSAAVHAAGRLESWLASHIGPITFTKSARAAYGVRTTATAAASPPAPTRSPQPRFSATTAEEIFAIEILNRQSPTPLQTTFTEDELKAVWRKAALKTHPDRFASEDTVTQTRMTVLFRELADAYATLLALTEAKAA